jgi:hypothetical protein
MQPLHVAAARLATGLFLGLGAAGFSCPLPPAAQQKNGQAPAVVPSSAPAAFIAAGFVSELSSLRCVKYNREN